MASQNPEILTMSRCERLLMAHPKAARLRIAAWLLARADAEDAPTAVKVDPRQLSIPATNGNTAKDLV
jgi:hypothetical protein